MFRLFRFSMLRRLSRILGLALFIGGAATEAPAMTLAKNGVSRAVVVVADDASEPEQYAARELACFLKEVTGCALPLVSQAQQSVPRLLVGPGAARLADPGFSTEDLGREGLVIRTVGNDLILAGGRPRGTLYAVYTFLEDHVGCRWWTPDASTIPHKPSLELAPLNVRFVPRLEHRDPFCLTSFDGDWAARNKCTGHDTRLEAHHGGKNVMEGFVHTFYRLLPPDKYFADHPEWFSLIDGERTHKRGQLCLTNEEMRRELIKNLTERLRSNPADVQASVSQNDGYNGRCECPKCKAIDDEEGSPAGSMLRFVNAVAADIEDEFPGAAISTLAYCYTRKPPRHARPRHNVIVWLCSIECSFSQPLAAEANRAFRNDIEGWSKLCDRLYVWDYVTNFRHYILPHPNLRVLAPNVRFFADHHVTGLFEQGNYQSRGGEMMELRAWMLAKLLWNPSLDGEKLIDEFLAGYFGPAAPHVRAYLDVVHDAVAATGDPLTCYSPTDAAFLSLPTLSKGLTHLNAAEAAVTDDPELRQRVKVAQLPVLYTFLHEFKPLRKAAKAAGSPWPVPESQAALFQEWANVARSAHVKHVKEGDKTGIDWLKRQLKLP